MVRFFMEAGALIFPVLILGVVVVVLTAANMWCVLFRTRLALAVRRRSIDSILVWGGLAAMLGFLGQWIGLNKMARIVAERGFVSPKAVAIGLSESLSTPLAGMFVLVVAAFLWFLLRVALWSRTESRA